MPERWDGGARQAIVRNMMRQRFSGFATLILVLGAGACGGADESVDPSSRAEADDTASADDEQGASEADDGDGATADDTSADVSTQSGASGSDDNSQDTSASDDDAQSDAADDSTEDRSNTDVSSLVEPAAGSEGNNTLPELGQECEEATECGEDAVCVTDQADFGFEGDLPGGMCSVRCDDVGSAACGATGGCVPFEVAPDTVASYCLDTCYYSEGVPKCGDSINRVCLPIDFETGFGVCAPKCFSDAECDGGYCNHSSGACVDEPPPGEVDGSECDVPEDCEGGICLRLSNEDELGTCISECSVHPDTFACHRDLDDTTPVPSACLPHLELSYDGIFPALKDLGHCVPTCDSSAGCDTEGWTCIPTDDPIYTEDVGFDGFCWPTFLIAPEALAELEGEDTSEPAEEEDLTDAEEPADAGAN